MLELSWLRQEIAQRIQAQERQEQPVRWVRGPMLHSVRRRQLLKLGVAGSALAPFAVHAAPRGALSVEGDGKMISILSSNGRRWTVDPGKFDGSARVSCIRTDKSFWISLADAALPGTGLRCDFNLTAELKRGSWSGKFEFPRWNGHANVALDEWIDGSTNALTKVRLPPSEGGCSEFISHFEGVATLQFSSDWGFSFEGEHIARLLTDGVSISCPSMTITLPSGEARLLIKEPTSRRACAVFSGADLAALRPEVGDLSLTGAANSELQVEYARACDGRILVASLWSADAVDASLNIRIDGVPGNEFQMPLDSYRLAQLHDGDRSSRALFAGVQPGERWTDGKGASVAIMAQANAVISAIETPCRPDESTYEILNAHASKFVIPFVGADSACFTRRARQGDNPGQATEFNDSFSFFRSDPIDLDDYALHVSRTTDAFAAIFRFKNVHLQSRRGKWFLTRKEGDGDSIVEFELPSQHLSEEAIFSASPPGQSKASAELLCGPFDSDQAKFVAYVGMRAFDAWVKPDQPADAEIQVLLRNFVSDLLADEKMIAGANPQFLVSVAAGMSNPTYVLPRGLSKYLTQEYGHLLVKVADRMMIRAPIQAAANKKFLPFEFRTWRPRAIDAHPTRLLFRAVFDAGAEVPCHLDTLMAWSSGDGIYPHKGLRFEELLSPRAVPADHPLEKQKDLKDRNGDRIFGLHEGPPPKAAGQRCAPLASVDRSTALELPYRLTVSPIPRANATGAVEKPLWQAVEAPRKIWGTTVALWHVRAGRSGDAPLPMRALHSPDFLKADFFNPPRPYFEPAEMRTSLDRHDRHNLVALSGGFGESALLGSETVVADPAGGMGKDFGTFVPQPFFARQLVLTSLGASFDMLGTWDPPGRQDGALTVSKWDHRARIRRDTEVTVEYRGYLLPLGIPAVFIKRTTREFKRVGEPGKNESYRTVLVQRYSIRVDQRVKAYPALYHSFDARDWCFRNIVVTPHETPPLLPPESLPDSGILNYGRQAFWPMIPPNPQARTCATGKLFEFTVEDAERAFKAPLVFVDNQIVHTPSKLSKVLAAYSSEVARRKWEMAQQVNNDFAVSKALARMVKGDVEFLPGAGSRNSRHVTKWFALGFQLPGQTVSPADGDPDQAAIDAADLVFNSERERLRQPPFYPRVSQALIESQLLAQLSGNAVERNNISYHPTFIEAAFDEKRNVGGVFVRFVQRAAPMNFGGNTASSGGAMSPTTMMVALAREHGPVGGNGVFMVKNPAAPMLAASARRARTSNVRANQGTGTEDPVAKFMAGISDPVEYFAGALGDAKLLGCVRLVDIIKTVLQVSGTRVPRINQKEIFDGVVDLLRPVLLAAAGGPLSKLREVESALSAPDAPAAAQAKLLPTLRAAIGSLEQARAELNQTSPRADMVASLAFAAYSQLRVFVNDARQLTENPIALLPAPVQEVIAEAQSAYNTLVQVRVVLENFPRAMRDLFVEAMAAETLALRKAIESSDEYRTAVEWVDRIQGQIDALATAIADNAWQRIGQALAAMAGPVADLRSWVGIERGKAEQTLLDFINKLCGPAQIAVGRVKENLQTLLEDLRLVEVGLKTAYDNAVQANLTSDANTILEAMRSAHQFREMLVTFIGFTDTVSSAKTDLISQLALASEYLQKLETLVRKFGEILSLCDKALPAQQLLINNGDPLLGLLNSVSTFVKALGVSATLTGFRNQVQAADVFPPEGFKVSLLTVLDDAVPIAQRIEGTPDELKAELVASKKALFEGIEKQLSLLVARLAPGAAQIVRAAEVWQERLDAIEAQLNDALKKPLEMCSSLDLTKLRAIAGGGPISPELAGRLNKLGGALGELVTSCKIANARNVLESIRKASKVADEVLSLAAFVGEAVRGGNLGALVDQRALVEQALAAIGVPTKLRISYDWETEVDDFPRGGGAVFRPVKGQGSGAGGQPQLAIHSVTEFDLRNPTTPSTIVTGYVDAFDLHLFGSAPFIIVNLAAVKFSAGSRQSLKLDVKVNDVKFGQALNFVNDLAKYIGAESGFYLQGATGVPGIEIGYRFNKDVVQLAAVTLQNVSLSLAIILPFNNSQMRLKVGVGSRQKPVLASVGIYGGGFFVGMTMRADAMELLEASMEYGGVVGVNIGGIATGTCKITAGVYIALGVRDEIAGFFSAVGALSIAKIMTVGASLVVTISKSGSMLTGTAVYSFEFSIGFVEYSYSVGVSYTKGGDKNMNKDAEERDSSGGGQRNAPNALLFLPQNTGAAEAEEQKSPADPVDYAVDMREDAAVPGTASRTRAGLADESVWEAYWSAFSDLDDAPVEMCTN